MGSGVTVAASGKCGRLLIISGPFEILLIFPGGPEFGGVLD